MSSSVLGKMMVIFINGGTNDVDKPGCNVNAILSKMIHFILKHNNINILMVTLPFRHDLANTSKTNLFIWAYNTKLKKYYKGIQTYLSSRHEL
jgi:hypothetical protein